MNRYSTIELSIDDGLASLVLNQPDVGNPFNGDFCREFGSVANELVGRRDVRAVLIRARGRFFSVGGDIRMFSQTLDTLPSSIIEWTAGLHMGMARLARIDAPLVAEVHASAMGGAVALISNCDLVICGKSASFGAAYPLIGYSCDAGATFGLASRMGLARARRYLLLGETLDATAAEKAGLVDEVVEDADLEKAALTAARKLSKGPTRAYGEIRRLFARSLGREYEAQLENEAAGLARVADTADAREGINAFMEKRRAEFQGS